MKRWITTFWITTEIEGEKFDIGTILDPPFFQPREARIVVITKRGDFKAELINGRLAYKSDQPSEPSEIAIWEIGIAVRFGMSDLHLFERGGES